MPSYTHECDGCGVRFEVTRSMAEAHLPANCSVCDEPARRIFDTSPIIFRPDGWNLRPDEPGYTDNLYKAERLTCQR